MRNQKVSIIVAMDNYYGIGRNNNLLCYLPADLKHFKSLTSNHTVIMGRNTFQSLPNGPLPNRRNIVISTKLLGKTNLGYEVVSSFWNALELCKDEEEVFAIGGANVYRDALKVANCMYITHIHSVFQADTFFPKVKKNEWKKVEEESYLPNGKNRYPYTFMKFERK